MKSPAELKLLLQRRAFELGFELFGIARISEIPEFDRYDEWLVKGYYASMFYLQNHAEKKKNPAMILENARSVVVCGKVYNTNFPKSTSINEPECGWISRYAWGDDYHDSIKISMQALHEYWLEISENRYSGRYYVDTGPVFERAWGKYAGIGWIGKNACLINKRIGSYFFISAMITDAVFDEELPSSDHCGSCTKCIEACPTDAIREAYVIDSNKCISFHTIENKSEIPGDIRPQIGRNVYGCDICQDVCPWNRKAPVTLERSFQPRVGSVNPKIDELLDLTEESFREKFRKSPIKRTKFLGLLRNSIIAAGNSKNSKFLSKLEQIKGQHTSDIDAYIDWAINSIKS